MINDEVNVIEVVNKYEGVLWLISCGGEGDEEGDE